MCKGVVLCPQCGSYEVLCWSCKKKAAIIGILEQDIEKLKENTFTLSEVKEVFDRTLEALWDKKTEEMFDRERSNKDEWFDGI